MALRGQSDSGPMKSVDGNEYKGCVNDGNFRALLRFRIDSGDDTLKNHLDKCNLNSSYINPHIQNEIIETCGNLVTNEIVDKINNSGSFSILADETTDISGIEQFTLCARYTETKRDSKVNLREIFLKFVPVHDTSGEALAQKLLQELKSLGVNLSSLKGQGYDGASAMSGKYKGCAAVIKKMYPEALYVHCSSHTLNLALSHACSVPAIRNSLATMKEIIMFFRLSPKRSEVLKEMILSGDPSAQRTRLIKFCETRWEEHLSAMVSYGDNSNEANPEEKETIPKMKYDLPPRFQKLKLANAKLQPFEPPRILQSQDSSSRLSPTLTTEEEPQNALLFGPSHHVALGRALKQAELLQYGGAYLEDFSLHQAQEKWPSLDQEPLLDLIPPVKKELSMEEVSHTVPTPDRINVQNNVELLQNYFVSQCLPVPEYNLSSRRPDAGRLVMYTATVKITGLQHKVKKFSSWPNENMSKSLVKGYAALKALEDLLKDEELSKSKQSTDEVLICERIHAMVADSITGVVGWSIENQYRELHNETLPTNWLNLVMNYPKLEVDSLPTGHIIQAKEKYVISSPMVKPPPLKFPEPPTETNIQEMWDVFVTHASGPNNVSFRLIGEDYNDKLTELSEEMERYYKMIVNKQNALIYECGNYYAASVLGDILRVCIVEVMEESRHAKVLLVDHGDTELLSFDSIYPLIPEFVQLPCQAIQCSLEGLEHFDDDESKNVIATSEDLVGKVLVAEIKHKDEENRFVSVIMFDTSNDEADVNINEKLADALVCKKATPYLLPVSQTMVVTVSSVSLEGEVYVQVPGPTLDQLTDLIDTITPEQLKIGKLTGYKDVKMNKIYMAKYSPNNLNCGWYRAQVIKTPSRTSDKITVQYMDYGNVDVVGISDLADVANLPSLIQLLPYQALKVEIKDLPVKSMSAKDMARLASLLVDQDATITIIDPSQDPPLVKMEVDEDGKLIDISTAMENLRSLEKEVNIGGPLQLMPELEDHDNWHQMKIHLSPNPSHFCFTKYSEELENLMLRMQAFYAILPLEAANIEVAENKTYACLYPADQAWYRVIVTNVLGDNVFVYLCDFGDTNVVPKENLRQLVAEFRQAPIMAMKARLGGICPAHVDWQVEDCTRFHQLVSNKPLFGKVLRKESNVEDLSNSRVVLKLLDPDEKKYIDDIFINENRAIKAL